MYYVYNLIYHRVCYILAGESLWIPLPVPFACLDAFLSEWSIIVYHMSTTHLCETEKIMGVVSMGVATFTRMRILTAEVRNIWKYLLMEDEGKIQHK